MNEEVILYQHDLIRVGLWIPLFFTWVILIGIIIYFLKLWGGVNNKKRIKIVFIVVGLVFFVQVVNLDMYRAIYIYNKLRQNEYKTVQGAFHNIEYQDGLAQIFINGTRFTFRRDDFYCITINKLLGLDLRQGVKLNIDFVPFRKRKCIVRIRSMV